MLRPATMQWPTANELFAKKTPVPPNEPVWIYLEREMIENIDKKPYNKKVGHWLQFLEDLKEYQRLEMKRKLKLLYKKIGPPWYIELSGSQRNILKRLKLELLQDELQDQPTQVTRSLQEFGLTLKITKGETLEAIKRSNCDPGIFLYNIYKTVYKLTPMVEKKNYDLNAMLLMSSFVVIDEEECLKEFDRILTPDKTPTKPKPKPPPRKTKPKVNFCAYLQPLSKPTAWTPKAGLKIKKKINKPLKLENYIELRSKKVYTMLRLDPSFLEKRMEKTKTSTVIKRECRYKFWVPPSRTTTDFDSKSKSSKNKDRKSKDDNFQVIPVKHTRSKNNPQSNGLKEKEESDKHSKHKAPTDHTLDMSAKDRHSRNKPQVDNIQYQIGSVALLKNDLKYEISNMVTIPTEHVLKCKSYVRVLGDNLNKLSYSCPDSANDDEILCDNDCNCIQAWYNDATIYVDETKCTCKSAKMLVETDDTDFTSRSSLQEIYFHPSTKHTQYWIDYPKIFTLDPEKDLIKDTIQTEVHSESTDSEASYTHLPDDVVVEALLADLANTHLILPHLPFACKLNSLKEFVRRRRYGDLTPLQHKRMLIETERAKVFLHKEKDYFKVLAHRVQFTQEQKDNINWANRELAQDLSNKVLKDFCRRLARSHIERCRLKWPSMFYYQYPSKAMLDAFFTYCPGVAKGYHLISPYAKINVRNVENLRKNACTFIHSKPFK